MVIYYGYFSGKSQNGAQDTLVLRNKNILLFRSLDESSTSMIIISKQDITRFQDPFQKGKSHICIEGEWFSPGENFFEKPVFLDYEWLGEDLIPLYPRRLKDVATAFHSGAVTEWVWALPPFCCLVQAIVFTLCNPISTRTVPVRTLDCSNDQRFPSLELRLKEILEILDNI